MENLRTFFIVEVVKHLWNFPSQHFRSTWRFPKTSNLQVFVPGNQWRGTSYKLYPSHQKRGNISPKPERPVSAGKKKYENFRLKKGWRVGWDMFIFLVPWRGKWVSGLTFWLNPTEEVQIKLHTNLWFRKQLFMNQTDTCRFWPSDQWSLLMVDMGCFASSYWSLLRQLYMLCA